MEEGKQSRNWFKILLGVLLTFYGISAAVVSYQASQLDGIARDMNFTGIREMTRGNDAYAVADNQFTSDYDAITQVILLDQTGGSEAAIQVWMDTLSDEALDAMDRIGDLDDQYNAEVYAFPDDLYANAEQAYQTSQTYADVSSDYEPVALILAMGLAFVGWSSLLDDVRLLRIVFAALGFAVLVLSVYLWLQTAKVPLPPEVVPLP